jgi:hypothetical protein
MRGAAKRKGDNYKRGYLLDFSVTLRVGLTLKTYEYSPVEVI